MASLLLVSSCTTKEKKISFTGLAQGTSYSITYYAEDTLLTQNDIDSFFIEFDKVASLWVSNSMISKINNNENNQVSSIFKSIFKISQEVSLATDGALDCTIGDIVNVWGFGANDSIAPSSKVIDSLMQYVGFQNVSINDQNQIIKRYPETKIDFNAIAKGFSVDMIAQLMLNRGIYSFIVDVGGEVTSFGQKPDGSLWLVGLEKPSKTSSSDREILTTLNLTNKSIATSGSYRKYYEKNGVRYSHTIDPKTGYPVKHSLLSTTVIADKCAVADAFATAFLVMGKENTINFLKHYAQLEVFLIYSNEKGEIKTWQTEGFKNFIM